MSGLQVKGAKGASAYPTVNLDFSGMQRGDYDKFGSGGRCLRCSSGEAHNP